MIKTITTMLIPLMIILLVGCQQDQQQSGQQQVPIVSQEESYKIRLDKLEITIKGEVLKEVNHIKLNSKLENLFDNDPKTGCYILANKTTALSITLSNPVYLKSIVLNNKQYSQVNVNSVQFVNKIGVFAFQGYDKYLFWGGIPSIELKEAQGPQIIDVEKDDLLKLFKIGYIEVIIPQEVREKDDIDHILWLSDVKLNISARPLPYQPTMSLAEIERIVNGNRHSGKKWDFPAHASFQINDKLVLDLAYYALNGNKNAVEMLLDYAPADTGESEWASGIYSWYEFTQNSPTASATAN